MAGKHLIIDTRAGEVMLKPAEDGSEFMDAYIGDNYDDYIATIEGTIYTDPKKLEQRLIEEGAV